MRVSSAQTAALMVQCLQSNYAEYSEVAEQMSTGLRINSPSDDAVSYTRLQSLSSQQAKITQYQENIETAESMLSASETQFSSMSDVMSELRQLAVQAGNGTYDSDDLASIAEEMQSLLDTMVDLANATDSDGTYLFSGSNSDDAAISVDTDGALWIEDYGSLNGTYIITNGQETQVTKGTPLKLSAPATVRIGDQFFQFTEKQA